MSQVIIEYLRQGPATSKGIQAYIGLSQASVSRQLRSLGNGVIKFKNGRTTSYALTCNAFGGNDRLPLSMVDAHGNTVLAAHIRPLAHGGYFVEPATGMPPLLLGEKMNGIYEDLPYFLYDLSPQGFLGRQIAEEMAKQSSDFPADPRNWNANHIGRYLVSNGDDLPGNLKFGEQALLRVRRKPVASSENDYPSLADAVIRGIIPGSSAGGEQPKFTAYCENRSAHVIVKFSPNGDNEIARRWRDILITEYHAIEAIHAGSFPAAETNLLENGGRLFLESQRFDRTGEYGRMSMVSLKSIDAEFIGLGSGWPRVMRALYEKELVSEQHVYDAECLWHFGTLINNTDMHLGNMSLAIEGSVFRILPLYDMCSMGFAPKSGGEVKPYDFTPTPPRMAALPHNTAELVIQMARDFWERVSKDERISEEFRSFLSRGNPIDIMKEKGMRVG